MADRDYVTEPTTAASINHYICYCCKRCARKGRRRCIPQEVMVEILLLLPARVVHDVMKHVCREWNLMISTKDFIQLHLRNSTPGFLIQEEFPDLNGYKEMRQHRNVIYLEMRRGCLEICKSDTGFEYLLFTSCNGLVVAPGFRDSDVYYVTNPLTKQRAIIPPNSSEIECYSNFALAFAEPSMDYKVVCACGKDSKRRPTQIAVLTIGVDSVWRHIDIRHSSFGIFRHFTFVTGGYVHWIGRTAVLTLNVENETISWFPMPRVPRIRGKFLPMGCNLSFLYQINEFTWDVWEMNSNSGEWSMIFSLDLEPFRCHFKDYGLKHSLLAVPYGWLAIREVLIFSSGGIQTHCLVYYVKTKEIQLFTLDTNTRSHRFQAHVNSLVWLEQ
ncbi:hypothetical protein F511_25092 [Dorcoceras hygrometricum]|uniref:F-box associated beta-propeller type 3 domain-containing protein n=1 Tax=Dorcoceras hygrometricum TaxID=472368 RepID=A0A2Z7AEA7_9LAMI|nr:hypothetical protein F511_25092 [Dorcoceras hygrometricum]